LTQPGHVAFVTGEYPPLTGGVGAYSAELAAALVARGWQVSVLTTACAAARPGGPVAVHDLTPRWNWGTAATVATWARQHAVNWVHVQYQTAAFGMHPAVNLAPERWRRQGLRVAWTYHDVLAPYLFPKAGYRLRHWVSDRPAATSDLTIVTNEGDRRYLAGKARRLALVPIGSNIQGRIFSAAERMARRRSHGFTADDLVVGYFGFLNRSKGGLTLVEALARLAQAHPGARLLMIGEQVGASDPTNYAYRQEVEAALARHGLQARVTWTGRLPEAEVSANLAACDVLLMPYTDGASLRRGTLMAGLAHGCAIATTTPETPVPELVEGRDLLYFPPEDAAAAAAAVLRIAGDPALAARLRAGARAVAAAFTWEGIAEAHERLYLDRAA
jgi:glycosyltransferase involved in cell wall biosynthesis